MSFVAAKIQQNCTGNYNSKATRQGIICSPRRLVILQTYCEMKTSMTNRPSDLGSNLNLGGQVVVWGAQYAPSGEIELTNLPKPGF